MTNGLMNLPFSWVRRELEFDEALRRGKRGRAVERVQEWLVLNGIAVVVDGQFGPATEYAVGRFQSRRHLAKTGEVDAATCAVLTAPLERALATPSSASPDLAARIAAIARQHLKERPREVGGANRGPWVRVYMEGHDGPGYLWCAGFACFVARQAAYQLGIDLPLRPTFSCDILAQDAQGAGRFVSEREIDRGEVSLDEIDRGSFFVQRRTANDWNHTGIVIATGNAVIETIEGNTNEGGSREGYEVCRRIRGLGSKDFVRVAVS